jgi:hypothetical protein
MQPLSILRTCALGERMKPRDVAHVAEADASAIRTRGDASDR